jgi:hypothetical protein
MPSGHRPPIPPGIARVALSGTISGHKWANVFYVQLTGSSIVAADLNTLATDIANAWAAHIAPEVTSSCVLTEVQIVYVPSVGNEVTGAATVSSTGSASGTSPENVATCFVINWLISAYYRGGHPRWYLPGIQASVISNGSDISGGAASAIASAASAMRVAVEAITTTNISGVLMGTLSFASGNAWRATPLFRHFTGQAVRTKIGSQRRRILA